MRPKFTFYFATLFVLFSTTAFGQSNDMKTSDFEWLKSANPHSFIDANGARYFQWNATKTDKKQSMALIEKAYRVIFNTDLGQQICRQVLYDKNRNQHIKNFEFHLGLSYHTAFELAASCRENEELIFSKLFYYADHYAPIRKFNLLKPEEKVFARQYSIITTKHTSWNYDSWTDSSNRTFLTLQDGKNGQLNWEHLLRVLIHELAVYFDSKQNSLGQEWSNIMSTQVEIEGSHTSLQNDRYRLALNNPLIQQVLTTWRAYNFEEILMGQIDLPKNLQAHKDDLSSSPYHYLADNFCKAKCLFKNLSVEAHRLSASALFLSTVRPEYRKKTYRNYIRLGGPNIAHLKRALIVLPDFLWEQQQNSKIEAWTDVSLKQNSGFVYKDFFYLLIDPVAIFINKLEIFFTKATYDNIILKDDLATINSLSSMTKDTSSTSPQTTNEQIDPIQAAFLENLSKPTLSSINIEYNHGPRPRVRHGAGSGGSSN